MATAVAALGRIRQSKDGASALPSGVALDAEGAPTTDPAKATTALPVGGPKGSGLSLMFECLTSLMAGAPILQLTIGPQGDGRHRHNAMVIAIDVARITDLAAYRREVASLCALIKALPAREGFDEIRLPGENRARTAEERRRKGIPLSAATWASLQKSAAKLAVTLDAPEPMQQLSIGGMAP
jgi:ureidoglycolate dehydrogenase (NAD+)